MLRCVCLPMGGVGFIRAYEIDVINWGGAGFKCRVFLGLFGFCNIVQPSFQGICKEPDRFCVLHAI